MSTAVTVSKHYCPPLIATGRRPFLKPQRCSYAPPSPPRQPRSRALSVFGHDRTSSPPSPLLDFLVPAHAKLSNFPTFSSRRSPAVSVHSICRRAFSASRSRRLAAVRNPRKDEEGNEMTIEISPRASHRLQEIMATDENPSLALRITVESGGCHGFQYLMSLTNLNHTTASPPSSSEADAATKDGTEDGDGDGDGDTVFEAADGTGAKVVMDEPSLELLKGSKIDYTMELIGSQFKIVDNPLATSSCGCGTSFDIKG
ncbi:MAG: [4Fe-4S] proteins maturation [Sclerophora amabilis]|nr:MAG: [4Fe-4S] proteins maturation [Sclerophora amabilis]